MRLKILFITISGVVFLSLAADMVSDIRPKEERYYRGYDLTLDLIAPIPKEFELPDPTPTPKPNRATLYHKYVLRGCYLDEIPLLTVDLKLTSLGKYFITAYCPAECGYNGYNYPRGWTTASDTICHRAEYENRYTEPTTCAIDRKIHSFGDLFYIEEFDRVFIAEDTGSAVKNKHLDLFYIEYSDVVSFPTGYYETYSVEYVYNLEPAVKYDVRPIILKLFTEEVR